MVISINQIPLLQELHSLSTALIELGESNGKKIIIRDSNNTYKCVAKGILTTYLHGKENSILKSLTQKECELIQLYHGIDDLSSKGNNTERKIKDQKAMLCAFQVLNRDDVVNTIKNQKKEAEIYTAGILTQDGDAVTQEASNSIRSSTNKDNNPNIIRTAPSLKFPPTFEEAKKYLQKLKQPQLDSKTKSASLNSNEFKISKEILDLLPPISQPSNNENDFFYKEPQKPYTNPFKNLPNSILDSNGRIIDI